MIQTHRITERDSDNTHGNCAICGRVKLAFKSGYYRCTIAMAYWSGGERYKRKKADEARKGNLPISEVARLLRIGKSTVYDLVKRGELGKRVDKEVIITLPDIGDYVRNQQLR